jgi:hypothetical protein
MEVPGGGTKSPVPPTREVHGGHGGTNSVIFCSYLRVYCSYLRVYIAVPSSPKYCSYLRVFKKIFFFK